MHVITVACKFELTAYQTFTVFLAWDCFELGRLAYNDADFYHTVIWMEEALHRLRNGDGDEVNVASVLDYLAFALYKV